MTNTTRTTFENETTLLSLYNLFKNSGDALRTRQTFNLLKKYQDERFDICFCGHFSAGKSSLLNELMNEDILPTSPIPTSANLVSISHGTPEIQIVYWDGRLVSFKPPYNIEAIKQLAKNGEEVSEIRVKTNANFPPHWGLMDTPGIDSTDPAHQAATEEAVQLSDLIFYVADYNHMQAADNFHFLKSIQALNKPFHIIVTQMDKHHEAEITLKEYKHKVEQGLASWGLHPLTISYVSIYNQKSPINELDQLKQLLYSLQQTAKPSKAIDPAVINDLISAHKEWFKSLDEEKVLEDEKRLENVNTEVLESTIPTFLSKKEQLEEALSHWEQQIQEECARTIKSAILMPYETREAAKAFLEAYQSHFKVGLFSTKNKVEKIRQERLDQFHKRLLEHVMILKTQTADTLSKAIEKLIGKHEEITQATNKLSFTLESSLLVSLIHQGATLSGEYVLQYTEDVSETIKKALRRSVLDILNQLKPTIEQGLSEELQKVETQLLELKDQVEAWQDLEEIKQRQAAYFETVERIERGESALSADELKTVAETLDALDVWTPEQLPKAFRKEPKISGQERNTEDENEGEKEDVSPSVSLNLFHQEKSTDQWITIFDNAAGQLRPLKGFQEYVTSLERKSDRLQHQTFTIALFGAFSAGKSSFANALIGRRILPVSPHPTTATINRILPIDETHKHETAEIQLKNEQDLLREINDILKSFKQSIQEIDELDNVLSKVTDSENERMTFLNAAAAGWKSLKAHFGTVLHVSLEEAHAFIADESKACFVEMANIYYDCDLTRQGLILVDTPGADSINARHTEAAFHYIKNADAILYVTYYNHAFSRADEEFLIQLGRVKDAFELDKMFFLVNAIDLARSTNESDEVKHYVQDRLLSFGIRHPRLYGVSSLLAIRAIEASLTPEQKASLQAQSGIDDFYEDWMDYIQNGLRGQLVAQGVKEIQQVQTLLRDFLDNASLSESKRKALKQQIETEFEKAKQSISANEVSYQTRLNDAIEEYYLYVKKRVVQRFLDEFTRFFNPAVLQRGKTASKKELLTQCLTECLEFLSFDLDQENRATFIRVESFMDRLIHEKQALLSSSLEKIGKSWLLHDKEKQPWKTAHIVSSLLDIDPKIYEPVFKYYKNPKQFFEGNGQKIFREALKEQLSQNIDHITEKNKQTVQSHYNQQWQLRMEELGALNTQDLTTQYQQKLEALESNHEQVTQYQNIAANLARHLQG
ncbi:GTPase Era involved in 16S rRNA processing [Pullulanibacillus pueri]|uniref:GTPase n=1 Tax=Pullulanibacillus pueri TaxID=1437324 RepID=A0A8J2ZVD9_9BACL|nr:dynamin family protein [Pullulanibacillus pueri]MBM7682315.1 GTPase Era involved in 16S rRNA processing [Pullulanibacillus pueri]GGH80826.1 GTPase [Pullulanibacillus pueri]